MDNHSTDLTDTEIQMLNGRCVMSALDSLKNHVTENEILSYFQAATDEPTDAVQQEIKRILELGVKNGFIVRNGDKYALTSLESDYQIDGDDDDDEDDVAFISPKIPRYEVFSSPTADEMGTGYKAIARHSTVPRTPPRKRKYTKRKPEPTDRVTRSSSRARASPSKASTSSRASASPAKRRRVAPKKESRPPTKFSSRTVAKGKGGGGRGRGR